MNLLNTASQEIVDEYRRAAQNFPPMHSPHEGWAVLKEEVDELWEAVRKGDEVNMREEAIQVGAMALRFLLDVVYKDGQYFTGECESCKRRTPTVAEYVLVRAGRTSPELRAKMCDECSKLGCWKGYTMTKVGGGE